MLTGTTWDWARCVLSVQMEQKLSDGLSECQKGGKVKESPPTCLSSPEQWKRKQLTRTVLTSSRLYVCVCVCVNCSHTHTVHLLQLCVRLCISIVSNITCQYVTKHILYIYNSEAVKWPWAWQYRCIRCRRWAGTRPVLSMCIQGHMYSSSCPLCWCSSPCPRRYLSHSGTRCRLWWGWKKKVNWVICCRK